MWGAFDGPSMAHTIDCAYAEIVHSRRNLFLLSSGRDFIREQTRLFSSYAECKPFERITLKAAMTMPSLLLQKPCATSKAKDHVKCLERRLHLWSAGDIDGLMQEGRIIQQHLSRTTPKPHNQQDRLTRIFARLMFEGKVRAALRLLLHHDSVGVLNLDHEINGVPVGEILKDKHPPAQPANPSTLLPTSACTVEFHPVLFGQVNGDMIRSAALQVNGSAGPSGVDAVGWRRMCTAFQDASKDLCDALAAVARCISTTFVDPAGLAAFIACRLIPLDKQPCVRPIGISETMRRIVSKVILRVTKAAIQSAVGSLQLCAGQDAGCEAAIHAERSSRVRTHRVSCWLMQVMRSTV